MEEFEPGVKALHCVAMERACGGVICQNKDSHLKELGIDLPYTIFTNTCYNLDSSLPIT